MYDEGKQSKEDTATATSPAAKRPTPDAKTNAAEDDSSSGDSSDDEHLDDAAANRDAAVGVGGADIVDTIDFGAVFTSFNLRDDDSFAGRSGNNIYDFNRVHRRL